MTLHELEELFGNLPPKYVTKDVDNLNKKLIKEKADVSFLKEIVKSNNKYNRTYFQVSLKQLPSYIEQYEFIEKNALLLNDWWHVDQLTQFVDVPDLDFAYKKASKYINDPHPFLRRWAYVSFMPTLVKEERSFEMIISLLKDDEEYYVQMAEAWLISYLAIYFPDKTLAFLEKTNLKYNIIGKGIQKICDSFRITNEYKQEFKKIRKRYK